jgi:hypothetical protein
MSLDPLKATKVIEEKYLDYLETTFAFKRQRASPRACCRIKKARTVF